MDGVAFHSVEAAGAPGEIWVVAAPAVGHVPLAGDVGGVGVAAVKHRLEYPSGVYVLEARPGVGGAGIAVAGGGWDEHVA